MVSCTRDNAANLIMLGTQLNEDERLSHTDEILGQESTTNENDTASQDVDVVVEEDEDDERSSSDDDGQDEDDDDEDDDDLEDDDDDLDEVVPSKSILCKPKPSNGGVVGSGAGVTSTTRGPSSSQLSQHRKHHHRRLAGRPAVTVGVKVGSSRGLSASKAAGLRARKVTSAACNSPACGVVTSSDEEYEEEVIMEGEVDELERESDDEDDDDIGPPDFLLPGDGDPGGIQGIPPDAQARLEAFFEAAGFTDGRLMSDPESLRKLTMTVSSALGEASAAINRMRDSQRYDETARRKSLDEGRSESMEEGDSLLALACSSGYFELARVLLAMGANVDDRGSKGDLTPLMDAASQGHVEIVRLLINHGAEVNAQSACGNSPLMYACAAGHEDIVKELLKSGANVEDNNENGHTPLMEAASAGHVGVAKILLEHGAGINTHSNEFKESALTVACYKGHLDMVKFLLEAGADQQHKTDEMHTALMEASMDGHVEVAKLLLDSGAQVNMPADSFESPLTLAACGGHVELAELLIERGAKIEEVNDEGYTPLMEAAREGHLAVVQCLLQSGAAINSQTEETHETALTLAACGGFDDVVALLLNSGADIELGASTPLMEAAQEGHLNVVKYLLERNADIRRQTQTGDTALSYACENGHLHVAELLVEVGADPEHFSEGGRTPLMKACRGGHLDVMKFLLQKGANVNRQTTSNDHTPLSLACAGGHVACVEALLAAGANPFHKLKDNSTMIIEAARGGHASVMKILLDFVPTNQTKSHGSEKAGTAGAKGQATAGPGKAAPGQKPNDPKAAAAANQNQAKNSVLRKSRSTSTLDPTPTPQPAQGKAEPQKEDETAKTTGKGLATDTQSQKNADGSQKQAAKAPAPEKKMAGPCGVCSECGATDGTTHHGHETPSTGQTSVKRSVRTEPAPPPGPSTATATATPSGPPLVPSQVTAATAISERPKAKPSKPSARKQLQQHQGGLSPGSDNGQGSPNGSVSSSSSGLSPVAISSASAMPGTPKTSQQLLNCVPASVTTSTSVLQMQVQPTKSGVSVATSTPGSSQIKLDSKQLSQLFVQHQQNMKNKTAGGGPEQSTSGMGHLGVGTPTTTTVVVHHGESETIIQGDNLPPGTSDLIFNAAAQAFPLEGFPVQCGQITSPSGVHIQSYHQLTAQGTVPSIGVTPLSSIPGGLAGFQQPLLLQHPPPLPAAMTAAAAEAGLVTPSGAPPPGAFKGSNNLPSSKAKESQKSNMSQMVKTLSGTTPAPVQQPQTPVPPVATVAGIQTTKKNLAKRTRPFGSSSGGTQNRQSTQTQTHANAHAKQNHAVASTQTNLSGQAADKILKHLDLDCATESGGETGLSVAAASGHYEVVEFLLARKAHMEHKDKKGCTPLILAADGGHDKIVELLLAHGSEIEAQSERTKDTALSLACTKGRYEVVEHLLKKGANKEHRNVSDYTPLSLAASGGYVNIIKLLLHHGAEINSRTGSKLGISPLMLAAMNGNTAAVKLLLDMGSDINAQIETNKNTALTLACFQGRQEVVSLLLDRKANLEHRAKTGLTPLMEAANGGYTEVGKILIDRGADVNAAPVPATKDTALTIAADKGHFRFVELLLQRGAMVEVRNKKGCTPLWLACHGGHSDVAQILFKHGADLDAQDNRRVSCLMAAFRKGHVKVIRWIVKNVQQFPSDGELTRFLSSIGNEGDLHKKCTQCEEFIKQAKDKQALEATRNANILLEELAMEQSREESKRQAAARRREKKKKKKQEKKHGASRDDDDDNDDDEQEEEEESVNIVDSGIDANSLGSNSSNGVDARGARKNNKENVHTTKQEPEPVVPEVVNQVEEAASGNSKSRKKKNKKEKDKIIPPASQESIVVVEETSRKSSSKDVLKENENRIAQEAEKIIEKAVNKAKDKRTRKEPAEAPVLHITPEKPPAAPVKDTNIKPKKTVKAAHEAPAPHHPEPLMGISVHPTVRKSGENTIPEASLSHYPPSPNNKTASSTSLSSGTIPLGKSGRKDDGWKEVTRSCPSSRSKKVIVPSSVISRVIGRGGCNINAIREATGAHIEVEKQQKGQLQPERTIQIKGSADATKQAHSLITALMNEPDLDVKKLLPMVTQSGGGSSVWSSQIAPAASALRPPASQASNSVPASAPIDTNTFGTLVGKKAPAKGAPSPVNLSSSPPVKKILPANGSNAAVVKTATVSAGKRPITFSANSHAVSSTASTISFASKVVPQQPLTTAITSVHTTPTKTTTPTFPTGSPTPPPPTVPSPSMAITTNGGTGQMRSPNQASVAPNLSQYGLRGVKELASETSLGNKVYGGFMQQDTSSASSMTSSLSQPENGGLSAFARTDASSEERIERPSPQNVPLEYAPFKYQFSKTTSSWYQDDFNQTSTTLTSQLGSPPSSNLSQQSSSGLGPVGSTAGLNLNSHAGNMAANRSMNFASVAASGISSNSTTTSAPMSQTGGVQNGNLGSLGGLITMSSPAKSLGDLFSDSDLPKVDASKAPGYRGNNSPSHRPQQQPIGPGAPFGGDGLSLAQFGGLIGSQGNQGLGYQNLGRQNSVQNNASFSSNNSGMGGMQQNAGDFMPRNLSPQSSNVLNFPNSSGQQTAPSQSRSNASGNGVTTNVVLSSRLNPRAPSFTLPHSKVSAAVQPPSQQFNQPLLQQQQHNAFKLGHLGQFGTRNTTALPNQARPIGGLNLGQTQGWGSYGDGSSSTDFQGLASSGQQQSMDQPLLSGLESAYEPPGSAKGEDRRSQRAIGPIGAERSLKGNAMGSGMNTLGYSLSQDPSESVHLGLQQQQNQSMHMHQQHQTSSWGGMFGSANPPLFPGSNQHHQQLPQLGSVAPSHSSHLARGNQDIRPFTGSRFLEQQVDQSRYLDYHQMFDGQRLMNGGSAVPSMLHMPGNLQQNMYPFGMEHNEQQQQQHIPKTDHLSNSWGDAHLTDDNKGMTWSKWGN